MIAGDFLLLLWAMFAIFAIVIIGVIDFIKYQIIKYQKKKGKHNGKSKLQ